MSLQRRVTLALAGIVALFVAVLGVLAFLSMEEQEDALVDEIVKHEAQRLAGLAARGALPHAPSEDLGSHDRELSVWLVRANGQTSPEPLPARLQLLTDGVHRIGEPAEHLHVVVSSTPAGRLVVQYDAERNEAKVREFGLYLVGLALLCVVLGAVAASRIARVVVGPIGRLAERLDAWAPDTSVATRPASDEESRLLDAFERVQARLEQAIAHERAFVANVAHEIRTPLAALRTDLEMTQLGADDATVCRQRLQRALDAVDAVAGALAAARAVQQRVPAAPRFTPLAQCVDDAWSSLGALPQRCGLRLVNAVPSDTTVLADRHALMTILRNLLRNAAEHAAPGTCTVRGDAREVEVADDGAGIAPADLPFVFDRYWSGRLVDSQTVEVRSEAAGVSKPVRPEPRPAAPGDPGGEPRGLGLAIAKQMADLNGWELAARSPPGGGTRFTLRLGG